MFLRVMTCPVDKAGAVFIFLFGQVWEAVFAPPQISRILSGYFRIKGAEAETCSHLKPFLCILTITEALSHTVCGGGSVQSKSPRTVTGVGWIAEGERCDGDFL